MTLIEVTHIALKENGSFCCPPPEFPALPESEWNDSK